MNIIHCIVGGCKCQHENLLCVSYPLQDESCIYIVKFAVLDELLHATRVHVNG